jgi:hypothetical protein
VPTNQCHIASVTDWRIASQKSREARAEKLTLPSGAVILAARPEPLDWILSGRVPQRLLAAALGESQSDPHQSGRGHPHERGDAALDSRLCRNDGQDDDGGMTREDVLELARFACELVKASVVRPALGDGQDEIRFEEIPVEDRAFIFQWACRALNSSGGDGDSGKEGLSSEKLERFRAR